MKYCCTNCCKLRNDRQVIRMPFENTEEYWCFNCYDNWANDNNLRDKRKGEKGK